MTEVNSHKRLAKNTMFLYLRMIINIGIALYTSRIILNALGEQSYGIYNVVGGTVAIVGFLTSTMSSSTSRFLSISIAKESVEDTKRIFGTSLLIHLCLAIIILIIGETIGVWFVNAELNYPESQTFAVNVTFQLSLLATCVSITQIPYDAVLVAHENFKVFAYFQIVSSVLKLGVALLLLIIIGDKLIIYSILTFVAAIIIRVAYTFYVNKRYEDSRTHIAFDKKYLNDLLSFSGWDLLAHLGFTARQQGSNILLNIFFGAAINAASGIATTIQGVISSFSNNIITSARPQIIKSYAGGDINEYRKLILNVSMLSIFMILLVIVPVMMNLKSILTLWLIKVPDYTYVFIMCCLISSIVSSISGVYLIGIHASGDVKYSSLGRNVIYILSVLIIYIQFKLGFNPEWAYIILIITQLCTLIIDAVILRNYLTVFLQFRIFIKAFYIISIAVILGYCGQYLVNTIIIVENHLLTILFSSVLYATLFSLLFFFLILNSNQRRMIMEQIKKIKK